MPYRGGGEALVGLLAGQVQVFFSTLTQLLPYIREGRLRGLAITSATRSPLAPDIPTMVESGFDQFITTSITTVVAPPNTPIEIRRQIVQSRRGRAGLGERPAGLGETGWRAAAVLPGGTRVLPGRGATALGAHIAVYPYLDRLSVAVMARPAGHLFNASALQ